MFCSFEHQTMRKLHLQYLKHGKRCTNKLNNKKYHTAVTVQKYHTAVTVQKSKNKKSQKKSNSIPLTYNYMTAHFPGLVQALQ